MDTCPAIFLFYRSLTCYLGGVGLVLILTCVVSQTGGLGVYNAEGHTDHLLPSAAKTARLILLIYTGLILGGALAYGLAGMTPFDALNISMCAVPTGGFATHSESIAYWHSPLIDGITIVLMIAGGTNFLLLFLEYVLSCFCGGNSRRFSPTSRRPFTSAPSQSPRRW